MKNGNGKKTNTVALDKKAVKAALNERWEDAIQINTEILELDPKNLKAKTRLGMAYLQTKEFSDAEKMFSEVLKADPINSVAKRNMELAKSKKTKKQGSTSSKKLINQPGMSEVASFELDGKLTADSFEKGEELGYRVNKTSVSIIRNSKTIGNIPGKLAQRLAKGSKVGANISVEFKKGKGKTVQVIFRADKPILKSEKQDVKPYLKKGSINEPELEIPDNS